MALKTGIPRLDDILNGGLGENKSILFYSVPGVENLQFAQQLFYTRLKEGDSGLYFVNNKKPAIVRHMFKNYDWDITKFERKGKLAFFDCYSALLGLKSRENFSVKDTTNLRQINEAVLDAMKKMKDGNLFVIIDSLSSLIDLCGNKSVEYLKDWVRKAKQYNASFVVLFTEWPYDKDILADVRNLFDCVVDLKAIERKVILRNYFSVAKADWIETVKHYEIPFKIKSPGGVQVYIPKILVTGPYHAGKTSFVHSASIKAVSVNRVGTTIALDHGHVEFRGFAVDLFGTPGQARFDPILEQLGGESLGVVVVVDSTDPKGFVRAKHMLELTKTEGLPTIIAANKADLKGALKLDELRKKMKLPDDIPIIPVIAANLKKVKKGEPCELNKKDIEKILNKLFEVVV
jgi:hypothetical protein